MDHTLVNKAVDKYIELFKEDAKKLLRHTIKDAHQKKATGVGTNMVLRTEIDAVENAFLVAVKNAFTSINENIYEMGITQFSGWKKPEEED
jgi:hypothetical protein